MDLIGASRAASASPLSSSIPDVLRLWAVSLLIKLGVAYWFPLFADEMYYWVWGQHLSLSYFDHPPFVAWLMWLGTYFENFGFAVRWPSLIFGHLSLIAWREVLKPYFSKDDFKWWTLIFLLNPMTGIGSIIVTPDVPLMVLWPVAILCFQKWQASLSSKWSLLFGLSLGFGFCAKYHMVLLLAALFLYLLTERRLLVPALKHLPLVLLAFVVSALPVLIWNGENDWSSFRFQLTRGLGKPFGLTWVLDYLGGQILLIFPTLLFLGLTCKFKKDLRLLLFLAWTPVAFFFVSSLKGRVEPNWTSVALPAIFALAAYRNTRTSILRVTLGIWALATILIFAQIQYRWLPIDDSRLKLREYEAFDIFIPLVEKYQPLYVNSYQMAATFYWKTRRPTFKLKGIHRPDHFDIMPQSLPNQDEFYALLSAWNDLPQWLSGKYEHHQVEFGLPMDMRVLKFTKK